MTIVVGGVVVTPSWSRGGEATDGQLAALIVASLTAFNGAVAAKPRMV